MADTTKYLSGVIMSGETYPVAPWPAMQAVSDAQAAAAEAKSAQLSAATSAQFVLSTRSLVGGDDIDEFTVTKTYYVGDLVGKDGRLYRCIEKNLANSGWVASHFEQTSYYQELEELRNSSGNETVRVRVFKADETATASHMQDVSVQCSYQHSNDNFLPIFSTSDTYEIGDEVLYGNEVYECIQQHVSSSWNASHFSKVPYTDVVQLTNSSGETVFSIQKGHKYILRTLNEIPDYITPSENGITYVANSESRLVDFTYTKISTTWSLIQNTGVVVPVTLYYGTALGDATDTYHLLLGAVDTSDTSAVIAATEWNSEYNSSVIALRYNDADTHFAIKKTPTTNSGPWSATNLNVTATQPTNGQLNDFRTVQNTNAILSAAGDDPEGKSFAAWWCRQPGQALVINGTRVYGNLPASGALYRLRLNITSWQQIARITGGSYVNIASNNWWSSFQYSAYYAWYLSNGTLGNGNKDNSTSVLPFFDL